MWLFLWVKDDDIRLLPTLHEAQTIEIAVRWLDMHAQSWVLPTEYINGSNYSFLFVATICTIVIYLNQLLAIRHKIIIEVLWPRIVEVIVYDSRWDIKFTSQLSPNITVPSLYRAARGLENFGMFRQQHSRVRQHVVSKHFRKVRLPALLAIMLISIHSAKWYTLAAPFLKYMRLSSLFVLACVGHLSSSCVWYEIQALHR